MPIIIARHAVNMKLIKGLNIVFLLFLTLNLQSQSWINSRVTTISSHPFISDNHLLHSQKIDPKGIFTIEPGINLSYETLIATRTFVDVGGSFFYNRFQASSAAVNLSLKYLFFRSGRSLFLIGIGPSVHFINYGKNNEWENLYNYNPGDIYYNKISWLSGQFEYARILSKKALFSVGLIHSQARSFLISVGVKVKISEGGHGCNCPSYR